MNSFFYYRVTKILNITDHAICTYTDEFGFLWFPILQNLSFEIVLWNLYGGERGHEFMATKATKCTKC